MAKFTKALACVAGSVLFYSGATAQVTGGQHAFEYLRMSNSPHVTALGGYAPANPDKDVTLTLQNPALLNPTYHNQLAINYNFYYAGIGVANLQYAYHVEPLKTDFGFGVQYFNYGSFANTDMFGNKLGDIRATDYSVNLSASRKYKERWRYGATLKWANSNLGDRSAMAALADVGVVYVDTANLWTVGLVAKNVGFTLKKYNPENSAEPLPFDLQLGITKQLKNLPLRLFVVAHHLYEWNIRYNNPEDKIANAFEEEEPTKEEDKAIADKIFRHLNFGAELILGKRLTITAAYNHLRRSELGVNEVQGTAGFSFGAGLDLNKLQVRYARSYYSSAGAFNEIGFAFQLNKFFGIGKKTEPWGWNKTY